MKRKALTHQPRIPTIIKAYEEEAAWRIAAIQYAIDILTTPTLCFDLKPNTSRELESPKGTWVAGWVYVSDLDIPPTTFKKGLTYIQRLKKSTSKKKEAA